MTASIETAGLIDDKYVMILPEESDTILKPEKLIEMLKDKFN